MKASLTLLSVIMLASPSAYALVDYTESDSDSPKSPASSSTKSMTRMPSAPGGQKSLTWKADYSLITNYESMEINAEKLGVMNVAAHIQTPADFYFEASYWNANTDAGSQSGNPKLMLGFNWLRLGSPSEEARLNLYGGMRLSSKDELASSRTDKIFGAETTKRFGSFGLGIGYDITLAGKSKRATELQIGNVHRLSVSGGWMVSNDIQFELEAENFKISKDDTGSLNGLTEEASFSTLSPKLNLGLAPAVHLEMGARFRMKKAKDSAQLARAGVFDLHGANSNSLFAGLNLSL